MPDLSIFPQHWGLAPLDEVRRAEWIATNVRRWHVRPTVAPHQALLDIRRRGYDLYVAPEALSGREALGRLFAKASTP